MTETPEEITVNFPGTLISSILEILLPFILSFIWVKYFYSNISCILIGIAGFIASVTIEGVFLQLVAWIAGKGIIFYIIAGLSPGIFEETGRYICLKYLLSKEQYQQKNISVSYGIGHGGIESFLIGITFLSNLFAKESLIEKGILKSSITFFSSLMGVVERIIAIIVHISASVLVYKAVKGKTITYYIIAIIFHDLIDLVAILYRFEYIKNIFVLELIIGIISSCFAYYVYKLYLGFDTDSDLKNGEKASIIEEKKKIN
jgi:uncharacterized membrane protein YhfC